MHTNHDKYFNKDEEYHDNIPYYLLDTKIYLNNDNIIKYQIR